MRAADADCGQRAGDGRALARGSSQIEHLSEDAVSPRVIAITQRRIAHHPWPFVFGRPSSSHALGPAVRERVLLSAADPYLPRLPCQPTAGCPRLTVVRDGTPARPVSGPLLMSQCRFRAVGTSGSPAAIYTQTGPEPFSRMPVPPELAEAAHPLDGLDGRGPPEARHAARFTEVGR